MVALAEEIVPPSRQRPQEAAAADILEMVVKEVHQVVAMVKMVPAVVVAAVRVPTMAPSAAVVVAE